MFTEEVVRDVFTGGFIEFFLAKSSQDQIPSLCKRYRSATPKHPKPYTAELRRLMELASGKYLVGQLTSPITYPALTACAMI